MPWLTSGCFTLSAFVSPIVAYSTTKLNYKLQLIVIVITKNDVMFYSTPNWLQVSLYNHTRGVLYCTQLWVFAKALPTGFYCVILGMEAKHCSGVSKSLCLLHLISKTIQIVGGIEMLRPCCITCARTWNVMMIVQQKYENKTTYLCSVVMIEWKRWQLWSSP